MAVTAQTSVPHQQDSAKNVRNGASKINGSIIYPGEEFSVHDAVVPFNAENGYELAGSYENGTTVETYGGGICQVSTTLYNAVIRAELEITERSAHSMIVSYVEPSMDAAISGEYKDLKFRIPQNIRYISRVIPTAVSSTLMSMEKRQEMQTVRLNLSARPPVKQIRV